MVIHLHISIVTAFVFHQLLLYKGYNFSTPLTRFFNCCSHCYNTHSYRDIVILRGFFSWSMTLNILYISWLCFHFRKYILKFFYFSLSLSEGLPKVWFPNSLSHFVGCFFILLNVQCRLCYWEPLQFDIVWLMQFCLFSFAVVL